MGGPEAAIPLSAAVFSILTALSEGDKHGYGIMKQVALPAGGAISMGPGTLYGSLDRMIHSGLIEETGETDDARRRYYRITKFGKAVLTAEYHRLSRVFTALRSRGIAKAPA